ncbi:TPA: hypothetical protein JD045_00250 [Citrobacter amalonaticus]|nr:hypothetical protein [Citrobacter amalonaticus]
MSRRACRCAVLAAINRDCIHDAICPKMPLASQTDTLYSLLRIIVRFKTVMSFGIFFLQIFMTLICFVRWTEFNQR